MVPLSLLQNGLCSSVVPSVFQSFFQFLFFLLSSYVFSQLQFRCGTIVVSSWVFYMGFVTQLARTSILTIVFYLSRLLSNQPVKLLVLGRTVPLRPSPKRVPSAEPSNRVLWVSQTFYDVLSKLSIKRIAGTKFYIYIFSSSFTFLLLVLQLLIDLESNPKFALTSYEAN